MKTVDADTESDNNALWQHYHPVDQPPSPISSVDSSVINAVHIPQRIGVQSFSCSASSATAAASSSRSGTAAADGARAPASRVVRGLTWGARQPRSRVRLMWKCTG
jgi:hypothetical protein